MLTVFQGSSIVEAGSNIVNYIRDWQALESLEASQLPEDPERRRQVRLFQTDI